MSTRKTDCSTATRWLATLACLLLLLTPLGVGAQEGADGCATATLQAAFKNRLRSIEQTPVSTIQARLNELNYGPVTVDDIMGWRTRQALQRFCRAQAETPSSSGIAATLIRLLFLEADEEEADQSATTAEEGGGPAVYYRWMAPDKSQQPAATQPQAAATNASAASAAAGDASMPSAQPACQGTAAAATATASSGTDGQASPAGTAAAMASSEDTSTPAAPNKAASAGATTSEASATEAAVTPSVAESAAAEDEQKTAPASSDADQAKPRSETPAAAGGDASATNDSGATDTGSTASPAAATSPAAPAGQTPAATPAAPSQSAGAAAAQQTAQACQPAPDKSDTQAQASTTDAKSQPSQELPDSVTERLKPIQGIAYPDKALFEQALRVRFVDAMKDYKQYKDKILKQARQGPIEDYAPIQVAGADCGCSRRLSSLVYGFYPFWLAQPESSDDRGKGQAQQPPQAIDFSLFDRIGFYALSLSGEGEILNPLQWSNSENIAQFINELHKYKVDVDLTVYATDWQDWTGKVMDKASSEVTRLATEKFTTAQGTSLLQNIPLALQGSSPRADGVTLVFDGYSRHTDKADNIVSFIGKLAQKLQDVDVPMTISILLGIDAQDLLIPKQQPLFSKLENILLKDITSSATVDYLLVYLPQPTSDSKKALRRQVENEFHGAERQEVLRKIVAVVSPDGHDQDERGPFAQYRDDLIYVQDNFKGVGFWPLPMESDASIKNIRYNLIDLFGKDGQKDHLRAIVDDISPQICQFVCPNRWLVRLVLGLLVGLVAIYALLSIWFCRLKELYKQYFLYFLIPPLAILLLALVTMSCDPSLAENRDLVLGIIVLILLAGTIGKIVSRRLRPTLP